MRYLFSVPRVAVAVLLCLLLTHCRKSDSPPQPPPPPPPVVVPDATIARQWADMTLYTFIKGKNTPTYSSRSLGYIGLTMYECVVHVDPAYRSMQGQLTGLSSLPQPEPNVSYEWRLVLNSGVH